MRIEGQSKRQLPVRAPLPAIPALTPSTSAEPQLPQGPEEMGKSIVIDAEKLKAAVEGPPRGKEIFKGNLIDCVDVGDDDDYFHLTCHVDHTLKQKIQKGEFVDLEKLLPRNRFAAKNEDRLEWVSKDGMAFLAPVQDRKNKIGGVRTWEQAFRIFSAINCQANPHRAGEIWQYIHLINSAASTYIWENVAYYDYTFRQMMAERPGHSWSKTYVQLWQLAMRDTIQKNNFNNNGANTSFVSGKRGDNRENHQQPASGQKIKTWHDNCCWKFGRTGKCDRQSCRFDNRCSYCGSYSHGYHACIKRKGDNQTGAPPPVKQKK